MNLDNLLSEVIKWLSTKGLVLIIALIVLFISFKLVNFFAKQVKKSLDKKKVDQTISKVVYNLIRKGVKSFFFLVFLGIVGIDTAGIGAAIGSILVSIGLALQGSLSNLAGGVIILVLRPFKIGEFIEAQNEAGTIEEIGVFYTKVVTTDNRIILIPNGTLANDKIINYSRKEVRRIEQIYNISYENDADLAIQIIKNVCENYIEILNNPSPPFIKVKEYSNSSINIVLRVWVKSMDYWNIYYKLLEDIKKEFDKNGIQIPYNKLDVIIKK